MREGRGRRSRRSKEGKIWFLVHCCQERMRKLLLYAFFWVITQRRQVDVSRILLTSTCLWRWNGQSVPKRWHINSTPGNYPKESIQHTTYKKRQKLEIEKTTLLKSLCKGWACIHCQCSWCLCPQSGDMSCGYLLPPGMGIHWSSLAQKNDFTYAATQSVVVPLSMRHVTVISLWRLRWISGHFMRTLDGKVVLGQVFLHVLHDSPPSIFPSALQARLSFIFHLCYMILPTDTMSATGTEQCMLSDITNMIRKCL